MKSTYTNLTQSKYFSPAFNSAIFDGPLRIYFAQFHESLALKIYFLMQQKLKSELNGVKEKTKDTGGNLLIMIYPTEDIFHMSFEMHTDPVTQYVGESWNSDFVFGLKGPIEDSELEGFVGTVQKTLKGWPEATSSQYVSAM